MKIKKKQRLQYLLIQQFSSLEFCGVKRFMNRPEHSKERFAVFLFLSSTEIHTRDLVLGTQISE